MAKRKPTSSVSPSGSGTISEVELPQTEYWYATIYEWEFTATPNPGYVFDHWERDGINSGVPYHYVIPSGTITLRVEWFSYKDETPDDGDTQATAYFRKAGPTPTHTGLILRSATSGVILRGASGRVLHDN